MVSDMTVLSISVRSDFPDNHRCRLSRSRWCHQGAFITDIKGALMNTLIILFSYGHLTLASINQHRPSTDDSSHDGPQHPRTPSRDPYQNLALRSLHPSRSLQPLQALRPTSCKDWRSSGLEASERKAATSKSSSWPLLDLQNGLPRSMLAAALHQHYILLTELRQGRIGSVSEQQWPIKPSHICTEGRRCLLHSSTT